MNHQHYQPDYGPVKYDINFDVSPTLRDYADAVFHLLLFIPAGFFLRTARNWLTRLENYEEDVILGRRPGKLTT